LARPGWIFCTRAKAQIFVRLNAALYPFTRSATPSRAKAARVGDPGHAREWGPLKGRSSTDRDTVTHGSGYSNSGNGDKGPRPGLAGPLDASTP